MVPAEKEGESEGIAAIRREASERHISRHMPTLTTLPLKSFSRSPLLFQGQAGVDAAGLCVEGAGGRRRCGRGPQDLLRPAFLPQVLVLLRRLSRRMLGLPGESGVRSLLFGLVFRAVKLCWGGDKRRYKFK